MKNSIVLIFMSFNAMLYGQSVVKLKFNDSGFLKGEGVTGIMTVAKNDSDSLKFVPQGSFWELLRQDNCEVERLVIFAR